MKTLRLWLGVCGSAVLLAGCVTTPTQTMHVVQLPPEEAVNAQAEAARYAGGFVVVNSGSSLTMPLAQDKALRRARQDLAAAVQGRVDKIKAEFLADAGVSDPAAVDKWFVGLSGYLRELILGGARPVMEKSKQDEDLSTVWMLMVQDPGLIVQAMEIRSAADRQLFELIRASQPYRALLADAERFRMSYGTN